MKDIGTVYCAGADPRETKVVYLARGLKRPQSLRPVCRIIYSNQIMRLASVGLSFTFAHAMANSAAERQECTPRRNVSKLDSDGFKDAEFSFDKLS